MKGYRLDKEECMDEGGLGSTCSPCLMVRLLALSRGGWEPCRSCVVPELRQYGQFMKRTVTSRTLERKTRTNSS